MHIACSAVAHAHAEKTPVMDPCAYLSKWSLYALANKTVSITVTKANQCINIESTVPQ